MTNPDTLSAVNEQVASAATETSSQAKVVLGPFEPGTEVWVRHRVVERSGPGPWCDPPVRIVVS